MKLTLRTFCFISWMHRQQTEMNLLLNVSCLSPDNRTGIERFALHITEELRRIDPSVTCVTARGYPEYPDAVSSSLLGFTEKSQYGYLARALWDQTVFRAIVHRRKPDVVFFPIQDGMLYPPCKQIVTVHDLHYLHFGRSLAECSREIHPFRKNIYNLKMPHILRHSTAIVAVSEATKCDIVDSFGIAPEKIHVVYNGYDEHRFKPLENTQEELGSLGLEAGNYLLCVGSVLRHKNIVKLIKAFSELKSKLCLVVAGVCKDPEYLDEIMKAASECGLNETSFRYLKYVSDKELPCLYAGARAFVLPSLHEGFGVPIIEAMACGTPVITSNCSAMSEVAGDAALLVDPYSVESISVAMIEILRNQLLVQKLRQAGFERSATFKWKNSASKLYELCKKVSES
mgnify:CR=1 FL=1